MLALAYAVNRAVPGAGTDHDRDNSSSFSMHRALSSGGNGSAAAVIAHAKINRSIGGSSAGGSSSSSARGSSSSTGGSSRGGGSSSGGGPSSGLQKRARDIEGVSGGDREQAVPPGTRSGGGLAVLRRIGVISSWACKAVAKLVGSTDHCLIQFICHSTIFCPPEVLKAHHCLPFET